MKTQYRIVESREGMRGIPFYQVESRTRSHAFWFWRTWRSGGETANVSGYGAHGLDFCREWIADQEKALTDAQFHYSGRVVYTQDFDSLSDGAQFLQQVEYTDSLGNVGGKP